MPNIGDTARGSDIGRPAHLTYRYVKCRDCGYERWTSNKLDRFTDKKWMRCNACRLKVARLQIGARVRGGAK